MSRRAPNEITDWNELSEKIYIDIRRKIVRRSLPRQENPIIYTPPWDCLRPDHDLPIGPPIRGSHTDTDRPLRNPSEHRPTRNETLYAEPYKGHPSTNPPEQRGTPDDGKKDQATYFEPPYQEKPRAVSIPPVYNRPDQNLFEIIENMAEDAKGENLPQRIEKTDRALDNYMRLPTTDVTRRESVDQVIEFLVKILGEESSKTLRQVFTQHRVHSMTVVEIREVIRHLHVVSLKDAQVHSLR